MPCYCYTNGDETIERFYPATAIPKRVSVQGKVFRRDIAAEHRSHRHVSERIWPMWSDAAGCIPQQVPQFQQQLASQGVKAEYDREGRIKFESRQHRRACCEALGLYDRSGGYGDPQRQ